MIVAKDGFFFDGENIYQQDGILAVTRHIDSQCQWIIYLYYSSGVSIGISYKDEETFNTDLKLIKSVVLENAKQKNKGRLEHDSTFVEIQITCPMCGLFRNGGCECPTKVELEKDTMEDEIIENARKYFGDRTFTDSKIKVIDVLTVMVTERSDELFYRVVIERHNEMFGGSDFGSIEFPSDKFHDYLEMIFTGANANPRVN